MSNKIRNAGIGIMLIGTSLSITAMPVQAESRTAQCRRFNRAMNSFSRRLRSLSKQRRTNSTVQIDRWLNVSERSLKSLQKKNFSDPRLRRFQQRTLDLYVNVHNGMIKIADAIDAKDRQKALSAYVQLIKYARPEKRLTRQFTAYCNRR